MHIILYWIIIFLEFYCRESNSSAYTIKIDKIKLGDSNTKYELSDIKFMFFEIDSGSSSIFFRENVFKMLLDRVTFTSIDFTSNIILIYRCQLIKSSLCKYVQITLYKYYFAYKIWSLKLKFIWLKCIIYWTCCNNITI